MIAGAPPGARSKVGMMLPIACLLLVAGFAGLAAGCADDASTMREPGVVEQAPRCANDETLSCIEKMGKTVSCSCSSRDELRRILEPGRN